MISKVVLASALALASPVFAAETGPAPGKLEVTLEADAAVATGVTPGATVVWLGVSRSREEWLDHFRRWRVTSTDDDRDGVVRYERKEGFPQHTILVAVDVASGTYAAGATFPLDHGLPLPDFSAATADSTGSLVSLAERGSRADVLVVRAGVGAWSERIVDGRTRDQDRETDGTVTIGLAGLRPLSGTETALDTVRPGDIVAIGDARVLRMRVGPFTGSRERP